MLRKTYQCFNYTDLSTYVEVEGKRILVRFQGGKNLDDGALEGGKYITANPKIIKALDSALGNNVNYKCILIDDLPDAEPEVKKELPKAKPEISGTPTEPPATDDSLPADSDLKLVPGITKVQDAKNYILGLHLPGVTGTMLVNKEAILKVATEHKIKFPDLP